MKEELIDWNIRGENVRCGIDSDRHVAWITHDFLFIVRSMKDNITQYTKAFIQAVCAPIKIQN